MEKPCWGSLGFGCATLALLAGLTTAACSSSSGNSGAGGGGVILTGNGGTASGGSAGSAVAGDAGRSAGDGGSGASAGLGGANSAGSAGTPGSGGHAGSAGSAGHSGSTGQSGSGGSTASGVIGDACAADTDCPAGLICLLPNDPALTSGGPANGLCTRTCLSISDCTKADAGAACVDVGGGAAYCLEGCSPGDPVSLSDKCHGRVDMACTGYAQDTVFLCSPQCRADAECGAGLFCNPTSGLCVQTKPSGDPVGTPCDPAAATDPCLGICLTTSAAGVVPATGTCAELCSIGTECMYAGTKPAGFCVGALSASSGALDLGYCEPSCNCDADCKLPGDICAAFTSDLATVKADLGTAGFCFPTASGSTELTTCN